MTDTFVVRASSWGELMDCPARWHAKHVLEITKPSSGAAQLGTALHASTAAFDQARVDQAGITADDAAGVLVDTLRHPEQPVDWAGESLNEAEKIGLSLHTRYCNSFSPMFEFKAVEMQTEPLDIDVNGVTIRLTGKLDRARIKIGEHGVGIADLKSGKRAVDPHTGAAKTTGHAAQLGVYELLYEHTAHEPITAPATITGLQTTKHARIGVGEVRGAKGRLIGSDGEPGLIEAAAQILKSGLFYGNPRSQLCGERYCPAWKTCKWRD